MLRKISSGLSYLLHPIFMPLWCVFFLFNLPLYVNYSFPPIYFYTVYAFVFINLIILPLSISLYLKRNGMIDSLQMETSKERIVPYAFTGLFYVVSYFLFQQIRFPAFYLEVFLSATLLIFTLLVLSFLKLKPSAHMAGIGGFCGLVVLVDLQLGLNTISLFSISIVLAGILASARIHLNAHNLIQLLTGFLLGLLSQLSSLLY